MHIPARLYVRLRALIWVLLAIFFMQQLVTGRMVDYVDPGLGWLAVLAATLLIAMASAHNLRQPTGQAAAGETRSLWPLLILLLPLLLNIIVPDIHAHY